MASVPGNGAGYGNSEEGKQSSGQLFVGSGDGTSVDVADGFGPR